MPYVNVRTNRNGAAGVEASLLAAFTLAVHEEKGDAVQMISATLATGVALSFGGDLGNACAVIEMTATAFTPDITARLTRRFTAILGDTLGVPPQRVYVFFREVPPAERHMVGWNGKTFLELRPSI